MIPVIVTCSKCGFEGEWTLKWYHHVCPDCKKKAQNERYSKNASEIRARAAIWRSLNRDKIRESNKAARDLHTQYNHERRLSIETNGPVDKITIDKLFERDQGICGICSCNVDNSERSIDHVIPVSKGGTHTWDNVQLAHLSCNVKKGNKLDYKIIGADHQMHS